MKIRSLLTCASTVLLVGTLGISHASVMPSTDIVKSISGQIYDEVATDLVLNVNNSNVENVDPQSLHPYPEDVSDAGAWKVKQNNVFANDPISGKFVYTATTGDYIGDTCEVKYTLNSTGTAFDVTTNSRVGDGATRQLKCDIIDRAEGNATSTLDLSVVDGGSAK